MLRDGEVVAVSNARSHPLLQALEAIRSS